MITFVNSKAIAGLNKKCQAVIGHSIKSVKKIQDKSVCAVSNTLFICDTAKYLAVLLSTYLLTAAITQF